MQTVVRGVRALRTRPLFDVLIAVLVFGLIIMVQVVKPAQDLHDRLVDLQLTRTGGLVLAAGCLSLVFRRRWPRTVLVTTVACALCYFVVGPVHGPAIFVVAVAMYSATVADRASALVLGAIATLVLAVGNVVLAGGNGVDPNSLLNIVAIGLAFALGDAVRNRRAYLAEVERRAQRAEESREQEARRRVAEERLRIARDLHDVVAHHIALINVQAGVGAHLMDSDPDKARDALVHIRRASRSVLDELSATVGLLRQADDPLAPTEPIVGLARLDELVAGLAGCGLRVDREVLGDVATLPTAVDVTAYRIVQEALTNVHKHARTDAARLRLRVADGVVRIVVDDDGADAGSPAEQAVSGHGLLGMRERAAAVGGSLSAGARTGGGFRVEAVLPLSVGG